MKLTDAAAVVVSNRVTEAGAATSVVGWLSQINWLGLLGLLVAVAGWATNWYFARRDDKRKQAESDARIKALRDRCEI